MLLGFHFGASVLLQVLLVFWRGCCCNLGDWVLLGLGFAIWGLFYSILVQVGPSMASCKVVEGQDRLGGGLEWDVFGQGSRSLWLSFAESSHA